MASAARNFTRAVRATPATSAVRSATAPRFAIARNAFRQQSRRGYADSGSPKGSNNVLIGSIVAAAVLGGGYYAYSSSLVRESSAAGSKIGGVFKASQEDYQKVYDAIAKRLVEQDDYDDGSYGPVLLRLGWHASGTFDQVRFVGGGNNNTWCQSKSIC